MHSVISSLRIVLVTLLICSGAYTAVVLAFARFVSPESAAGSLIHNTDGTIVGSRLVAQKFTKPEYFWSRPSAVDYNASGAGGSNKSPTSTVLTDRAQELIALYGATPENPLPAELVAASGAGLDPHITAHAALYQAQRVAAARGLGPTEVESMIRKHAFASGGALADGRLVNVLELNLDLDAQAKP